MISMNRSIIKRISFVLTLFIAIMCFSFAEKSEAHQIEMLLKDANDYILSTYGIENYYPEYVVVSGKRHYVNLDIYDKYGLISYYSFDSLQTINSKKDLVQYKGESIYRYIGYTAKGERLYNTMFPADSFHNSYSSYVLHDVNDKLLHSMPQSIRDALVSNFLKSATESIYSSIERHYTMRSYLYDKDDIAGLIRDRKSDWDGFFKSVDRKYWEKKIKIESLPSPVTKGVVLLTHGKYYYTIDLTYEENTYGVLAVKHIPVSKSISGYIRSYSVSGMSDHDFLLDVQNGDELDISADEVKGYHTIGYSFFDGKDSVYRELESGEDIGLFVLAKSYIYKYLYNPKAVNPVLVFYYEKDSPLEVQKEADILITSEDYNVERAIPSLEKVTVIAQNIKKYLYDFNISAIRKQLDINVHFIKDGGNISPLKSRLYYEYEVLDSHYLFVLDSVVVNNPKLMNASLTIKNAELLDYDIIKHDEHKKIVFDYSGAYDVSYEESENCLDISVKIPDDTVYMSLSEREQIKDEIVDSVSVLVRNDLVSIGGEIVLTDEYRVNTTLGENTISDDVITLERETTIDEKAKNGRASTTGKLIYKYISGDIPDISSTVTGNDVSVHTPVYNNMTVEARCSVDQRAGDKTLPALVLDEIYTLKLSSEGSHIDEKGYGTRDYNKYVKKKFIILPFDAFVSSDKSELEGFPIDKELFRLKNTKIAISPDIDEVYMKPAYWEDEGACKIESVYVAINESDDIAITEIANLDKKYNAVKKSFDLDLIGKIFDFRLDSIADPRFLGESFSVSSPSNLSAHNFCLPVKAPRGSGNLNHAIKIGYPVEFTVCTMGSYRDKDDVLVAIPRFIYVDTKGRVYENIALFTEDKGTYHQFDEKSLIYYDKKSFYDSKDADLERYDTLKTYADLYPYHSDMSEMTYRLISSREVFRFSQALALSTAAFRVFDKEVVLDYPVNESLQKSSLQVWSFIYGIPNNTVVFLKDADGKIDYKSKVDSGFLGVYFDVFVSKDNNINGAKLKYKTDSQNQWQKEGYRYDKPLDKEIVLYYNLSEKASDDISLY